MAGAQRAAHGSRVSIDGTPLNLSEWDTVERGDDLDTTTFEDSAAETGIIGVEVIEWNIGGDWDAGANPQDDPPGLFPRDDLTNLRLFENVDDNVFHLITPARVLSAKNGAQIRGKVTFGASGKSNGVGSINPTGSV